MLAIHFAKGATSLRLFTTLATLGTPQDVTAQEIRIECFFPGRRGERGDLQGVGETGSDPLRTR